MIKPNTRISNIPATLQEKFNIGSEVDVEETGVYEGGVYRFLNNAGQEVEVAAVEFAGHSINIKNI